MDTLIAHEPRREMAAGGWHVRATRQRSGGADPPGREAARAAAVLIVEDDAHLRRSLLDELRAEGFDPRAVAGGADALRFVGGDWAPEAIFVDLLLPRLEAYAICRALRSTFAVPVIVAVSSGGVAEDGHPAVDAVVARPVRGSEIVARLRDTLAVDRLPAEAMAELPLPRDEYVVLRRLSESSGRPVSRGELLARLSGIHPDVDPRVVDVYLVRLMVKFADSGMVRIARTADQEGYLLLPRPPALTGGGG